MGAEAITVARALLDGADPHAIAGQAGVVERDDGAALEIPFLGTTVSVRTSGWEIDPAAALPPHVQALLLRYLATARDVALAGEWIPFLQLPDGGFYHRAFQGYTGDALVRQLHGSDAGLGRSARSLGGVELSSEELSTNADHAWRFGALPRVPVVLLWWCADDEFDARAELLFDRSATTHLPTDGCAVLGSWLVGRLVAGVS